MGANDPTRWDEDWMQLYRAALLELEHAQMTGRIGDARKAIFARIEKLQHLPGLHADERHSLADALSALTVLEREEDRYQKEEKQRILNHAAKKLRSIAPRVWQADQRD
jgi:hypothetical protein